MHELTSKRQVTIPKAICDELGLEPGDMVDVFAKDGVAHIVKMSNDSLANQPKKKIGLLDGKLDIPEDFDEPLADDTLKGFEDE
ncbi:AbrB/MazE/SpoVT family DNA-binding domain-containing protein [Spartinivicinus ruber]|uniref:AbrB/MazE/SpoVT family DNA-binding domain-containing protein n=1 Tax=Spartinivicinus ruber TaxID=2683272 RepID=UPI0013D22A4A|nr:AbrB/MazE/SpoVT family DNA-binding domain-containing protein [Spartinivicinus ruber]